MAKHGPNRGRRNHVTDLEQFAPDAEVTPARILSRHSDDQLSDRFSQRWATGPRATSVRGPPPSNQFAMPAQHGFRLYQQCSPGRAGQPLPQSGQDHTITRLPSDALDLSLEHLNLPAQRQHLGP